MRLLNLGVDKYLKTLLLHGGHVLHPQFWRVFWEGVVSKTSIKRTVQRLSSLVRFAYSPMSMNQIYALSHFGELDDLR